MVVNKYYILYLEQKERQRKSIVGKYSTYLMKNKTPQEAFYLINKEFGVCRTTLYNYLKKGLR